MERAGNDGLDIDVQALWNARVEAGGAIFEHGMRVRLFDNFITSCFQLKEIPRLRKFFESGLEEARSHVVSVSSSSVGVAEEQGVRRFILDHFAPEAALTFVMSGLFDKAVPLLEHAVHHVAHKWAELHPLAVAARHALLAKVPLLEALQQSLDTRQLMMRSRASPLALSSSKIKTKADVKAKLMHLLEALTSTWAASQLSIEHDTPNIWEALRYTRAEMLRSLYGTIDEQLRAAGAKKPSRTLRQTVVSAGQQLLLQTATGMRVSGALDVSTVYLKTLLKRHAKNQLALPIARVQRELFENNMAMAVRGGQLDHRDGAEMLSRLIKEIHGQLMADKQSSAVQGGAFDDVVSLKFLRARAYSILALSPSNTKQDSLNNSQVLALEAFDSAVVHVGMSSSAKHAPEILSYSLFCSRLLETKLTWANIEKVELVAKIMATGLQALRLSASTPTAATGGTDMSAAAFFPRLLTLLRRYRHHEEVVTAFEDGTHGVQSWQILHANSQLLSMIGNDSYARVSQAILQVLTPLCELYPDAVFYNLDVTFSCLDDKSKRLLAPLRARMWRSRKGIALRTFSAAILQTVLPHHRYIDGLRFVEDKMFDDLDRKESQDVMNSEQIRRHRIEKLEQLRDSVLGRDNALLGRRLGTMQINFAKRYGSVIKTELAKALNQRDAKKLRRALRKHRCAMHKTFDQEIRTSKVLQASKVSSYACSEWFSQYSNHSSEGLLSADPAGQRSREQNPAQRSRGEATKEDEAVVMREPTATSLDSSSIEIPGLYQLRGGGMSRPIRSELHPRIASFGDRMLQLNSIRKPRRLKIVGSDYKIRYFLAKGGEDLRNDQRVEAMLTTMNGVFARDPACRRKGLRNVTFAVVPMSGTHGLVQWLESTEPLKAVYNTENSKMRALLPAAPRKRGRDGSAIRKQSDLNGSIFLEFFRKHTGTRDQDAINYLKLARKKDKLARSFTEMCINNDALASPYLLRNRLMRMAPSPESFHHLRTQFCKAVATNSMCGYLLGIGDRHLENFLFSNADGSLALIDFGHTFGQATFLLPVPELLPFRLTPQLVSVMAPLPGSDLLRDNCVDAMRAMRNATSELEAMTEAIVNDPLVEWTKGIVNKKGFVGNEEEQEGEDDDVGESKRDNVRLKRRALSLKFNPMARINLFRDKLKGVHPSCIMRAEMEATEQPKVKENLKSFLRLIDGPGSQRAAIADATDNGLLDAKTQVDCLIDIASDREILSRSWIGLNAWL
jgi:hypothetical protein